MFELLPLIIGIFFLIIFISYINDSYLKLSHEIILMLFSCTVALITLIGYSFFSNDSFRMLVAHMQPINFEDFLLNGALCFMLFAGSCHLRIHDFKAQFQNISVLSFLATFLGTVFYGLVFYGLSYLLSLNLSIYVCLMFGSIVSPTDPIAATSILNKYALPKKTSFLIEGESLLNDGVGVALFVLFSGLVSVHNHQSENMFLLMVDELCGAAVIGAGVTYLSLLLLNKSSNFKQHIYVSLFAVSMSYYLSQITGCSGPIASVVCGICFSSWRDSHETKEECFKEFDLCWETLDNFLNSVLYVVMGISMLFIFQSEYVVLVSVIAIISNLLARGGSVYACTFFMKDIPDGFSRKGFSMLLTWGGLRGALCIALAMSCKDLVDVKTFHMIMAGTYALVFFTTICQGLTVPKVYSKIEHD